MSSGSPHQNEARHETLRKSSRDRGSAVERTPSLQALGGPIAFYPGAEFTPAAQVPPAASSAREEEADPTPDSGARADFCADTENTLCCPAVIVTFENANLITSLPCLKSLVVPHASQGKV